jgi:hypothetical protein
MNAPFEPAHSPFGGSVAARILGCPASVGLVAKASGSSSAGLSANTRTLALFDEVKDLRTAVHDQAKRALENGDVVRGWCLTAGRAERHWRDDEPAAIAALEGLMAGAAEAGSAT